MLIFDPEVLLATADIIKGYCAKQREIMDDYFSKIMALKSEWSDDETFGSMVEEIRNLSRDFLDIIDEIESTYPEYFRSKAQLILERPVFNGGQGGSHSGGGDASAHSGGDFAYNPFSRGFDVEKALKGVEYRPIEPASAPRTEQDIIDNLSGGDETEGSCSSLALAYAGNKAGYEVLDFRGGNSRRVFSSRATIEQIASLNGVDSVVIRGKDDSLCAEQLMTKMQKGKEYYLATGGHAAVVRLNNEGRYQYLELQSGIPSDNGWQPLTLGALFNRFGCEDGQDASYSNYLIELGSLQNSREFLHLLGYINTAKYDQMKGADGHVR